MHNEPLMVRVGQRLRAARIAAGLTVREAAAQLGLRDHSQLVRYENGLTQPPLDRLAHIAAVYRLSLAALLAQHDAAMPLVAAVDGAEATQLQRIQELLDACLAKREVSD